MTRKDYDRLARHVPCEFCHARSGEACIGAGGAVKYTHSVRRAAANKFRRENPGWEQVRVS